VDRGDVRAGREELERRTRHEQRLRTEHVDEAQGPGRAELDIGQVRDRPAMAFVEVGANE